VVIDGKASLSIKSLTNSASDVTAVLGLEPTASAEIGDPVGRVRTGADGKPSMRERTHSIWALDAEHIDSDDRSGFAGVRSLVALLESRKSALKKLHDRYFMEIRWSGFSDSPQGGFLLPSDLLVALGSLGLDFHGTVYLTEDRAEVEATESAEALAQSD